VPVPVVALVGYTNAGKSTLLNTLTGAGVMAEDKLFATLDPTTRRAPLPSGREVLFTDTVGFINNLPTLLIAAFRATLEEINEATVLLHVVDGTHPNAVEQIQAVNEVLEDLGADDKPVVVALNKLDRLVPAASLNGAEPDLDTVRAKLGPVAELVPDAIPISAANGWGLDRVLGTLETIIEVEADFVAVQLTVPYDRSDLVNRFHGTGRVETIAHDEAGTTILGTLPAALLGRFAPFVTVRNGADATVTRS
jgi:GTP-binding protein HflX